MNKEKKIREKVKEDYTKAIETSESGCCSSGCGCGSKEKESLVADKIGYLSEDKEISQNASSQTLGCGNPLAFNEVKEGEVVLDLGSGAGFDLLIASKKVGESGRVVGVDMTDAMIKAARKNIKDAGVTNVEVRKGIIEALPVESASVDWVISNCVINLSPEKKKVFSEIFRVLKPGGKMSVSDIVADDLPQEVLKSEAFYSSCIGGAISEKEYMDGLKKVGLTDVEVVSQVIFGKSQLDSFLESDALRSIQADIPEEYVEKSVGKIASNKFFARKPK